VPILLPYVPNTNAISYPNFVGEGLCSSRWDRWSKMKSWLLSKKYDLIVDRYIIMPNYLHLLLRLERAEQSPAPTISEVICTLKSITTKKANLCDNTPGRKIWQRSFYDHIIRNEQDYLEIWRYIDQNPLRWELDEFYTAKEKPLVV